MPRLIELPSGAWVDPTTVMQISPVYHQGNLSLKLEHHIRIVTTYGTMDLICHNEEAMNAEVKSIAELVNAATQE